MFRFFKKQLIDIKTYGIRELLKKFVLTIKLIIKSLMDLIAIVPCILIRLASPWIVIRIQRMEAGNFGEFVFQPAIYFCKKKLNIDDPKKKCLDFVYIDYNERIYNKYLEKIWKRRLNFLSGYILDPINRVNKIIPGGKKHIINNFKRERNVDHLFEKYQPFDFTNEEIEYGKKTLSKFGLSSVDKFVLLLVRDEAYQLKKIPAERFDWSYNNHRHTDINKFYLAAETLTKKGYFVFRMGVVVEKPFTSKNTKIIDYANSELRNDFMDIYLGANCEFCISTGSGFQDLPRIFKKPLALIETPLGYMYVHNEKHLLLTKHHFSKKENRKLTLSEIFSNGVAYAHKSQDYKNKGIKLLENTSEEIRDLAIEMTEILEDKKLKPEEAELQEKFRKLYSKNVKKFSYADEAKKNNDSNHQTIIENKIKSRFSSKFLNNNKEWLR